MNAYPMHFFHAVFWSIIKIGFNQTKFKIANAFQSNFLGEIQ